MAASRKWSTRAFIAGFAFGVLVVLAEIAIEEELRWTPND